MGNIPAPDWTGHSDIGQLTPHCGAYKEEHDEKMGNSSHQGSRSHTWTRAEKASRRAWGQHPPPQSVKLKYSEIPCAVGAYVSVCKVHLEHLLRWRVCFMERFIFYMF